MSLYKAATKDNTKEKRERKGSKVSIQACLVAGRSKE